jgi:ATP-dependent DNA helicase DinG
VTSTRDNCMGAECQYYQDCFVMKARREAQQADVVVVNHHLFFADVALKDTGMAELLPSANTIIFDEAHQLPEPPPCSSATLSRPRKCWSCAATCWPKAWPCPRWRRLGQGRDGGRKGRARPAPDLPAGHRAPVAAADRRPSSDFSLRWQTLKEELDGMIDRAGNQAARRNAGAVPRARGGTGCKS